MKTRVLKIAFIYWLIIEYEKNNKYTRYIFTSLIKLEEFHLPFQKKHYEADMDSIIKNMIFRKFTGEK
jgi:hypothetical protein